MYLDLHYILRYICTYICSARMFELLNGGLGLRSEIGVWFHFTDFRLDYMSPQLMRTSPSLELPTT
jgi:hypothetical protein